MASRVPLVAIPGLTEVIAPGAFAQVVAASGINGQSRMIDLPTLIQSQGTQPSIETLANAVIDAIRDLTTPVDLLAEDLAATVAIRIASRAPSLVRSCIFVAPLGFPQPLTTPLSLCSHLGDVLTDLADPQRFSAALSQLCAAGRGRDIAATLAERPDAARLATLGSWWASGGADATQDKARQDDLRSLKQPVQLVWGRDDRVAGLDSGFYLLRRLRSVQLRVLPFCGHLVALEAQAALSQVLGTFVRVSHEPERLAPAGTG